MRAIEAAGFKADVFESDDTTEPAGTVFRQSPEANQTPAGRDHDHDLRLHVRGAAHHAHDADEPDGAHVPDVAGDPATGGLAPTGGARRS